MNDCKRLRFGMLLLAAWVGLNYLSWLGFGLYDRIASEEKFRLRRGILSEFEERTLDVLASGNNVAAIRYRVFSPRNKTSSAKLPVILSLHGSGERGNENASQVQQIPTKLSSPEFQKRFPCFVIAPQCFKNTDWTGLRRLLATDPLSHDDVLCRMVGSVLESAHADPNRVYLVGYSMGSFGAWKLAADHPEVFAAVVPISGGGPVELADRLMAVPIYAVHGESDPKCPAQQTREIVGVIRKFGGEIRYEEIEGAGHAPWGPNYENLEPAFAWMFQQARGD